MHGDVLVLAADEHKARAFEALKRRSRRRIHELGGHRQGDKEVVGR